MRTDRASGRRDVSALHADTATAVLKPRNVRFDWSATPPHWIPGEPVATHTINVLHLLLPAGERWFVRVLRQVLPDVTDERLREQLRGFLAQEAIHARAHAQVLDHLREQGLDTARFTAFVDRFFDRMLGDDAAPGGRRREWLLYRVAVIAALEHFTALLGQWALDNTELDRRGADPVMLDLLRWHAAEEVEHRAVAFDVLCHLAGPGYLTRVRVLPRTLIGGGSLWVAGARYLLRHDPAPRDRPPTWRDWLRAGRQGLVPGPVVLARMLPSYLRPSHHPSHIGNTRHARAYLAASPAARAAEERASTRRADRETDGTSAVQAGADATSTDAASARTGEADPGTDR